MSKLRAVEVISDKFWITYDIRGNKTGTMRADLNNEGWMIQYLSDGSKIAHDSDNITELFEFVQREVADHMEQHHVFGYPVPKIETFKIEEQNNLPCFTKTVGSKVFFAAGYYGINFDNGGWMESFCPKAGTLKRYEYLGPFKTESDMQIAVKRKKRTYD
jgi:hypothetical protein